MGAIFGWLTGHPWVLRLLRYGAIALTVILFLLSVRRAGERAGRMAQKLETMEKADDAQRKMLDAAADRPRSRDDLVERMRDGEF